MTCTTSTDDPKANQILFMWSQGLLVLYILHHIDVLFGLVHLLTKAFTLEEYIYSCHLLHKHILF